MAHDVEVVRAKLLAVFAQICSLSSSADHFAITRGRMLRSQILVLFFHFPFCICRHWQVFILRIRVRLAVRPPLIWKVINTSGALFYSSIFAFLHFFALRRLHRFSDAINSPDIIHHAIH